LIKEQVPYWQSTKCPIKKRGIPPQYTKLTEEHIDEIIIMYKTGKYNYKQIANHFNRHLSSIAKLLNKRGFIAKSQSELQRKYKVDESFFDEIDTEDKAYFLGLLYADGCNNVNNYEITLCLEYSDLHIIKSFLKSIKSGHPIVKFSRLTNGVIKEYCRISIGSKRLSLSLENLGCMQTKTFKIEVPTLLPCNLINHFFRGYFDGDGCFGINKKIKSNMLIHITSNKFFLLQLQELLVRFIGLNKTKILQSANKNPKIGVLCYGGRNNCIKIRDWMYNDATIFLKRKHKKLYSI